MQIVLFGDIMIQGRVAECCSRDNGDELVSCLNNIISQADLAIGNFETFICPEGVQPFTEWHSPPEAATIVARAGFDIVSVATNHTWDHGKVAVENTLNLLELTGVKTFGLGDAEGNEPVPLIIEKNGARIALLGYAVGSTITKLPAYTGVAPSKKRLQKDISAVKPQADIVIVTIHSGGGEYPTPELCKWADIAVQVGANAVVAHHSHKISAVRQIGNGVVAYGLANTVAALNLENPGNICLRLEIENGKMVGWSYDTFFLDERGFPYTPTLQQDSMLRQRIEEINNAVAMSDYSKFYWSISRIEGRRKAFLRSWSRDIRTFGIKNIFSKIKRIRPYHFRLLWNMLWGR